MVAASTGMSRSASLMPDGAQSAHPLLTAGEFLAGLAQEPNTCLAAQASKTTAAL
jgi:hypothetical protein